LSNNNIRNNAAILVKPAFRQVSVVIPAYDNPGYLKEALASVLSQSFLPGEILVVDDGSPEPLEGVVEEMRTGRNPPLPGADCPTIRYVRKEHSGIAATRNRGVSEAREEFILWLDSDDVLLPATLAVYRDILSRFPDADVIYGDLIVTDEKLQPRGAIRHADWYRCNRDLLPQMVTGNPIPNPGTLVRKTLYQRFGGYDETLPRSEDYDWWTRVALGAVFKHCGSVTLKWRWHSRDIKSGRRGAEVSADAIIVQRLAERYPLTELFSDPNGYGATGYEAEAAACLGLADRLLQLGAKAPALEYLKRSHRLTLNPDIAALLRQLGSEPDSRQHSAVIPQFTPVKHTSRPLRILLAAQSFPPYSYAGTELYTYNLARELQGRGHDVQALYPSSNPQRLNAELVYDRYDGLEIARINLNPPPDLVRMFRNETLEPAMARLLRERPVDVVHFQHLFIISANALKVCHQAGVPTLLTLHDTWVACEQPHLVRADGSYCAGGPETVDKCVQCMIERHPEADSPDRLPGLFYAFALRRYFLRQAFGWADTVISPTRFLKEFLARHEFHHPRFLVEQLGLPPLATAPRRPGNGRLRLAFLGNISPTKGLDILMAALQRLDSDNWELDIYGRIHSFTYYEQCMDMAPKGGRVANHGPYTPIQLGEIFAQTDVTAVASRAENFPTVARESLQAGVPVVAPRVGGIPEIVSHNANGLLFNLGDADDLARQLKILTDSPTEVDRLRRGITPPRSIANDANRLEEIYEETMHSKASRAEAVPVGV
jgi:glycosyltransferase involved in cell wall biosynthesis